MDYALIRKIEEKKAELCIHIPHDDIEVRKLLRHYHEPVTYFAESHEQRRERLAIFLRRHKIFTLPTPIVQQQQQQSEVKIGVPAEDTTATQRLRRTIHEESRKASTNRIQHEQENYQKILHTTTRAYRDMARQELRNTLRSVVCHKIDSSAPPALEGGGNGGTVLCGKLLLVGGEGDKNNVLLTGHANGAVSCWNVDSQLIEWVYPNNAHNSGRVKKIDATIWDSGGVPVTLTCEDKGFRVWKSHHEICGQYTTAGGQQLTHAQFHPTVPNTVLTTSRDHTWSMWNLSEQSPVWTQTGHSFPILCGACHCDGAIFVTGDESGLLAGWDIRASRSVFTRKSHDCSVLCVDFCSGGDGGNYLATGSDDNAVHVWDIRRMGSASPLSTLQNHTKMVTTVKFGPQRVLWSGSADGTVKMYMDNAVPGPGGYRVVKSLDVADGHRVTTVIPLPLNLGCFTFSTDQKLRVWKPTTGGTKPIDVDEPEQPTITGQSGLEGDNDKQDDNEADDDDDDEDELTAMMKAKGKK
eukprot:PhF_6_TR37229/c0_g1_i2/m.54928/K12662/PRPF4, PRP4; U4/U6 small nuclear ribonucleoprotein PRP4